MKKINNMVLCALLVFQAYGAKVPSVDDFCANPAGRLRNQSETEHFQTLRLFDQQNQELLARIKDVIVYLKFFSENNPEDAPLLQSEGYQYFGKLGPSTVAFREKCIIFLHDGITMCRCIDKELHNSCSKEASRKFGRMVAFCKRCVRYLRNGIAMCCCIDQELNNHCSKEAGSYPADDLDFSDLVSNWKSFIETLKEIPCLIGDPLQYPHSPPSLWSRSVPIFWNCDYEGVRVYMRKADDIKQEVSNFLQSMKKF
ncbi:MAG: hypothetical protein OXC30_00465 [Alphaproteobacteria bacterium]|nr:hypothetical protein [Alphaproteobacteria bacterium]